MLVADFLASLVVASASAAILYACMGWRHPADDRRSYLSLLFLFAVLLAFTWAGGVWLPPFGPRIGGVPIVPFVTSCTAISLLLALLRPQRKAGSSTARRIFSDLFAVLVFALLILCVMAYVI